MTIEMALPIVSDPKMEFCCWTIANLHKLIKSLPGVFHRRKIDRWICGGGQLLYTGFVWHKKWIRTDKVDLVRIWIFRKTERFVDWNGICVASAHQNQALWKSTLHDSHPRRRITHSWPRLTKKNLRSNGGRNTAKEPINVWNSIVDEQNQICVI